MSAILIAVICQSSNAEQQRTVATLERLAGSGTANRNDLLELSRAYQAAGRHYEASRVARQILATSPGDPDATAVLDQATQSLKDLAGQKVDAARAAVAREGATDNDRLALADAYFEASDYRAAIDIYSRLPEAIHTPDSRLRHARALSWSGHYDDAEQLYATLLSERPSPDLQLEYGRVLSWMGSTAASIRVLREVHAANPSDASAVALANARAWNGDRTGAMAILEQHLASHAPAPESTLLLRELQESAELQLERADRRVDAEPYNLALRVDRARLRYDAGSYAGALRDIEFVREHSKQSIPGLDELEHNARERRDAEIARLDERRRALTTTPMTSGEAGVTEERLSLAKAYTGHAAYDQAASLYEEHLRTHPDDIEARLQYARVLNWDQRYGPARKQYELVLQTLPERADLRYEYAQVLSYDSQFVPAMRTFRGLTDLSGHPRARLYPDIPPKAYYNIGQIYRWYGWNDTAVDHQNKALALDGEFGPARSELTLARQNMPSSRYGATVTFFEDANDFRFRRADIDGERWLSQRTAVEGSVGRHHFERGSSESTATSASGGLRHRFQDRLTGRGRVGLNVYDQGLGTRPFWGLGLDWLPNIQTRTAFDYNHYDLVYDVFTLESLGEGATPTLADPLDIDDFRGRLDYQSGGFWSFLGDASYGFISDDNNRQALHGLLSFRLLRSPFVAIKADGRYLSYDFRSDRYWSPEDYRSLAGVLQVGGDFRNRLYWTLETKAGKSWERDRSSDIRTYHASLTFPVTDTVDLVGSYSYGKSGRFDNLIGGNDDFVNYWQRRWYVGVRLRQLFARDDRTARNSYYYDNRVLTESPVLPPAGEMH